MDRRRAVGVAVVAVALASLAVGGTLLWGGLGGGDGPAGDEPPGTGDDHHSGDGEPVVDHRTDPSDGHEPTVAGDRPGHLDAGNNTFAGFQEVAETIGLEYGVERTDTRVVSDKGVYVADVDNDGYEDLLLLGGSVPILFENVGGEYREARTFDHERAQVAHFFDYDNDGYRDLVIASEDAPPVLYENEGGTFRERAAGFSESLSFPTTMTSADVTGNGCLDLYVGVYGGKDGEPPMGIDEFLEVGQQHPDVRPATDNGEPNRLYEGDCGSFTSITEATGVAGADWTLGVSAADFTGNGHVDLYVANDWTGDYLFENHGNGSFSERDIGPNSDRSAMASVAVDATGNHHLDMFVTNIYYEEYEVERLIPVEPLPLPHGNNLFANEGDGQFTDIAPDHGLEEGSWGWAGTLADYTNDGHLDVIHASSFVDLAVIENHSSIYRPPQVWKGTADSWEKIDGFDVGFDQHNFRGVARVDHDNDGTLDFVGVDDPSQAIPAVEPGLARAVFYENQLESDDSLQLFVRNPDGLETNAGVYIETDERTVYREVNARGDLLSQDSRLIHVGTANETVERVVVEWPDGTTSAYEVLEDGERYVLTPEAADLVE